MTGFYKIRLKPSFIIFIKINTSLLVGAPSGPLKGELPVSFIKMINDGFKPLSFQSITPFLLSDQYDKQQAVSSNPVFESLVLFPYRYLSPSFVAN